MVNRTPEKTPRDASLFTDGSRVTGKIARREEWKHASDRPRAVRNEFLVGGATGQLDGTR